MRGSDDVHERPTEAGAPTPATGPASGGELPTVAATPGTMGVDAAQGFPVAGWDRYRFVSFLGEGGMGRVYEAFDPRLKRHVALKFLRSDDPDLNRRFLQEAQAQARVEHENVCRVYEVGEVQGRLYIALPLIEGRTLTSAARGLTLEEKVEVMRQVAEGLHAAHRIGLVHRDVKPGNVLCERREDGSLHPYVMDFGLAREALSEGMTATGSVVGTPWYMAPEQALGRTRQLDRRADVFSAGATLYELFAGEPPFEGESPLDVLKRIVEEEPVPLSRRLSGFPADLDTIVLKCLQKEPSHRYDSARALADDLKRFLDGEPILARPLSFGGRLVKRARRNLPLTAALAALSLVLLLSAAMALRAAWVTRRQTELARSLGEEVREIEVILRFGAYTLPLHDVTRELSIARGRLLDLTRRVDRLPGSVRSAGDEAVGRGLLALGELPAARERLERAHEAGRGGPDLSYALGLTLARLYERELRGLAAAPTPAERARRKEALEKELKRPALVHLSEARTVRIDAPEYVRALVADLEGDWDRAVELAAKAAEAVPWFYEARTLEGRALRRRADAARDRGADADALEDYRRAEAALLAAVEVGRSYPEAYLGLCTLYSELMDFDWKRRLSPTERFATAAGWCEKATRVDPANDLALLRTSDVHWRWAEYQTATGEDPRPALARSIELAERTIPSRFDLSYSYDNLGIAWNQRANWERENGLDPRPAYGKAIGFYTVCLTEYPNLFSSWCNAAQALASLAAYEIDAGLDPSPHLEQARALVAKGGAVSAHFCVAAAGAQVELEALRFALASTAPQEEAAFERAEAAVAKARAANPSHAEVVGLSARLALLRAEEAIASGADPLPWLSRVGDDAARIARLNPAAPEAALLRKEAAFLATAAGTSRAGRRAAVEAASERDPRFLRRHPSLAREAGLLEAGGKPSPLSRASAPGLPARPARPSAAPPSP